MNIQRAATTVSVNGQAFQLQSHPGRRLSDVLREEIGLRGTKVGCDAGDCGACTVLLDGEPVCACLMPVSQIDGRSITTIEGIDGEALQQSFLRHGAAQCGICTPGMIMAATALLQKNPKPKHTDVEEALGGVLCRCTGYQKIVSAVCDAADRPSARNNGVDTAIVGSAVERLDGPDKVTGADVFGADDWPDDALLVRAVRSPFGRAGFAFGDIEAWRSGKDGVVAVVTASDIAGTNQFGVIPPFADQPALATGQVRFRGEAVALVVGDADLLSQLDLSAFPVSWTEAPEQSEFSDNLPTGGQPVHDNRPDNVLASGKVSVGDVDSAMSTAEHVSELKLETSYVEHAYIEPEAGCAWLDGDILVIKACTQAPYMDRDDTARILGLPPEKVRIIPTAVGGGFGSKLDISLQPLIGLAVLKTGRPCRMVFSRTESMMSTTKRHPARMTARVSASGDGTVQAMRFSGDFNTGAYASWGPTVATRVPVHASGPYRTPNYLASARAIHTNGPVSGAFRGFGVPQAAILQEALYDDLANSCGIDRLEFRLKNALREGDRSVCGQTMTAPGIVECLESLKTHWETALSRAAEANRSCSNRRRGIGLASCWYGCGNTALPNPATVRVGLTPDGRFRLHQGATDIGQGSNTVIAQICADALGIPLDQLELVGPDTAVTPDCGKTSASRQTVVTGTAALRAGQSLRQAILRLCNRGQDAAISVVGSRLKIVDGSGESTIEPGSLQERAHGYVLMAEEIYDPPTTALDENGQGKPYAVYGFGAQMAEIEVDTALGTIRVLKMVAAHDVGRVINPILAQGQIEGGIAQGLGMALMEEYVPGRTENLHDYLIPTIGDMPTIETILVEKPDPEGPLGAKGLGEHALIPTAPAILNALHHACGVRVSKLPALPHRVLAAIQEANPT